MSPGVSAWVAFENKNKPVSVPIVVTMCTVGGFLLFFLEKRFRRFNLSLFFNLLAIARIMDRSDIDQRKQIRLRRRHIDEMNVRNPYIYIYLFFVWYVRHPRAAIDITLRARYISIGRIITFAPPHCHVLFLIFATMRNARVSSCTSVL